MRFPWRVWWVWVVLGMWARAWAAIPPLEVPPPPPPPTYRPFAALPDLQLDEANNRVGAAQQVARQAKAQARMLWIDATANLDRLNSAEKITALVARIKKAGFNTIVLDVKPICGYTLYPSAFAPKLTSWRRMTLPAEVDPLAEMTRAARAAGLSLIASMNVFSEGHRGAQMGPGFAHPEWQATFVEPQLALVDAPTATKISLSARGPLAEVPAAAVGIYANTTHVLPPPDATVALLDSARKVVQRLDGATYALKPPPLPRGGALLVSGKWVNESLKRIAQPGATLSIETSYNYVPASAIDGGGIPLWTNPHSATVQARLLDMVGEVVTKYPVDGVVFDDRMRFAGANADFSETTRKAFEAYVGRRLSWPNDVLRYEVSFPTMARRLLAGPYYEAWVLWRAVAIRNWVARAVNVVKGLRPGATVGIYAGSWYGEYAPYGANYAATDFQAGFRFLTDDFRRTGFAGLVDWMSTGCYYETPTIAEAAARGLPSGYTVEAAGQLSNRCANSDTWVYAGVALDRYNGDPAGLGRALQAAAASTQGIMVFDLSHNIDQFWPVFEKAFASPAPAPHTVPGLLTAARAEKARRAANGLTDPPVIIMNGAPGTGL